MKGHIVVFPSKVEDLVATVLPHPLLETTENIHISWSGSSKPSAADVGQLLQVRKSVVRAALSWLTNVSPTATLETTARFGLSRIATAEANWSMVVSIAPLPTYPLTFHFSLIILSIHNLNPSGHPQS